MSILMKRNLKLFFRDRSAVFSSLMAAIIIIGLYVVFLGGVWLPDSMGNIPEAKLLMNSWLLAGLLAVASVTTTMGAFGIMIEDKSEKIDKDLYASPIKRKAITGGYLLSAFLIGVMMSLVTVFVGEIYIILEGGRWLTFSAFLKAVSLVFLAAITNTSVVCFIVSFFKSHNAFGTVSGILSTLIGFLTGIYLPIGALPAPVQTVIKAFPASYAASMFRQVLMDAPMQSAFDGTRTAYLNAFKEYMGITFRWGGYEVTPLVSILILAGTAAVFYSLALLNMSGKKEL